MSGWFLGEFTHTIDSQRRIAIPRDWRRPADGEGMVFFLLPGRDQSIQVLPQELFESSIVDMSRSVSFASRDAQALSIIGSKGARSVCDRQGRITLTPLLMEHAKLDGQAALIGSITSIRIMAPEQWARSNMSNDDVLDVIERNTGAQEH